MNEFLCQRCGNCCLESGWVYVSFTEIKAIARFLKMSKTDFLREFTIEEDGWTVIATPFFHSNCFLDENNNCTIYPVRPRFCKDYPTKIKDENEFKAALKTCPGLKRLK